MRIISRRPFNDAAKKYPNDAKALTHLYAVLNTQKFKTPDELKAVFHSLDNFKYEDKWWVVDVGGNNLRMVAAIQFVHELMHIKFIGSHADYDKFTAKHRK